MQLEASDSPVRAERPPYLLPALHLRWSGIFAGLVVGIATNLLLMMVGTAAGLAVFEIGASATAIQMAAVIWNTVCMVTAAFVGGYVAARSAGMRRGSDGLLHGAVAWGATMLLSALLAMSAAGAVLGGVFSSVPSATTGTAAQESATRFSLEDRDRAVRALQDQLGISAQQANALIDQALVLSGRAELASPDGRATVQRNLQAASLASGWISASIVLSLLAAVGGGLLGAHGARRFANPQLRRRARALSTDAPAA